MEIYSVTRKHTEPQRTEPVDLHIAPTDAATPHLIPHTECIRAAENATHPEVVAGALAVLGRYHP